MVDSLLAERVAIVTGAGQGIGLEIARTLDTHGARVVLVDLDGDAAKAAADEVDGLGLACDVTCEEQVKAVVRDTVGQFGRLDVFVNNAGITRDASLKKMTVDQFDAVITVHLRGTWLGVREASTVMREAKTGSIINISSLSGKSGNPGQTNYSAAKAGIVGLTKAAAKELAHHNVRVNAVQPGLIRTPMTAAMPPGGLRRAGGCRPDEAGRGAGRSRRRCGLPGFGSGQLHHRHGHRGRRRPIHMTPVSVSAAVGIGRIVLNRPEQLNAINVELAVALEHALVTLAIRPGGQRGPHSRGERKLLCRRRFRRGRTTSR